MQTEPADTKALRLAREKRDRQRETIAKGRRTPDGRFASGRRTQRKG